MSGMSEVLKDYYSQHKKLEDEGKVFRDSDLLLNILNDHKKDIRGMLVICAGFNREDAFLIDTDISHFEKIGLYKYFDPSFTDPEDRTDEEVLDDLSHYDDKGDMGITE